MITYKVTESYCSNIEKFFRLKAVTEIVVHIREDIWATDSLALATPLFSGFVPYIGLKNLKKNSC